MAFELKKLPEDGQSLSKSDLAANFKDRKKSLPFNGGDEVEVTLNDDKSLRVLEQKWTLDDKEGSYPVVKLTCPKTGKSAWVSLSMFCGKDAYDERKQNVVRIDGLCPSDAGWVEIYDAVNAQKEKGFKVAQKDYIGLLGTKTRGMRLLTFIAKD